MYNTSPSWSIIGSVKIIIFRLLKSCKEKEHLPHKGTTHKNGVIIIRHLGSTCISCRIGNFAETRNKQRK